MLSDKLGGLSGGVLGTDDIKRIGLVGDGFLATIFLIEVRHEANIVRFAQSLVGGAQDRILRPLRSEDNTREQTKK